jgi:hypothetical protein
MELRVEVANAAGLRGRMEAAVRRGKIPGWKLIGERLITRVADRDVQFETSLDLPARPPGSRLCQFVVYRVADTGDHDTASDAVTRLEVAIRNRFVAPLPEVDPIDDFGAVIAEFVIRE